MTGGGLRVVSADWPVRPEVHGLCTERAGGFSQPPFDSLDLGEHCGDDPERVARNRDHLARQLRLPAAPRWLDQVHGARCVIWAGQGPRRERADAAYTRHRGEVLAILTADCLPVLLASDDGEELAAAHGGWRGLLAGVLESALAPFSAPAARIHAWLGPAIGPAAFQVGDEVRSAFVARDPAHGGAFVPDDEGRWRCDIYRLARHILGRAGVASISGGTHCTVSEAGRFYSYRRDGRTGRMATLLWRP